MIIFHSAAQLAVYLRHFHPSATTIGFVPTMGALHEGHASLVRTARQNCQLVVASIFVNPTQFNDPVDFEKYPQTPGADIALLEQEQCQLLYMPVVQDIYPAGTHQLRHYELGYLDTVLEAAYRPGHFQGVCNVVHRLLELVAPTHLFMGQKDYQQCMVVQQLLQQTGLHQQITLQICPTLREADGLAMSSRNKRLSAAERRKATAIFNALQYLRQQLQPGNLQPMLQVATAALESEGFRVDYVAIAHAQNLALVQEWNGKDPLVALVAAFNGEVRLIDNLILTS